MIQYEIPLKANQQRFRLNLKGREFQFTLRWSGLLVGGWFLNIDDLAANKPFIHGIPLVAGADLMEQYEHLKPGFQLYIGGDGLREATRTNLGTEVRLYIAMEQ